LVYDVSALLPLVPRLQRNGLLYSGLPFGFWIIALNVAFNANWFALYALVSPPTLVLRLLV